MADAALQLEFTTVRAPVSGTIGKLDVTAGNLVTGGPGTGTRLALLQSLDPIHAYFEFDPTTAARARRVGQRAWQATITPFEGGGPITGAIDFVDHGVGWIPIGWRRVRWRPATWWAPFREQNVQVAAGAVGQQPSPTSAFQLAVDTRGCLSSPEEFEQIIVRTDPGRGTVRLRDVARVELGANQYALRALIDNQPAAAIQILQDPTASALEVWQQVRDVMQRLAREFPAGVQFALTIAGALNGKFASIGGAMAAIFPPPPVPGLGAIGGFKVQVQDRGAKGPRALYDATQAVLAEARSSPKLAGIFSAYHVDVPRLQLDVDRERTRQLGIPLDRVHETLQAYLGSVYVLAEAGAMSWLVAPRIAWSFLDWPQLRRRARAAGAVADAAFAEYEQATLLALEEVHVAVDAYGAATDRLVAMHRQLEAAAGVAGIVTVQYREGLVDSLAQTLAERDRIAGQLAASRALAAHQQAVVDVYRSLGGGWE